MRNLINIITEGFAIPDPASFITPQLVYKICNTFQWSEHGSDLYRFVEEMEDDGVIDTKGIDPEEYAKTDEFKEFLTRWLKGPRSDWLREFMVDLSHDSIIERTMVVSSEWLSALVDNPDPVALGVFWAEEGYAAAHNSSKGSGTIEVTMATSIPFVVVNWEETVLSRIDYENGDDEHEVQLVRGSIIQKVEFTGPDGPIRHHPAKRFTA